MVVQVKKLDSLGFSRAMLARISAGKFETDIRGMWKLQLYTSHEQTGKLPKERNHYIKSHLISILKLLNPSVDKFPALSDIRSSSCLEETARDCGGNSLMVRSVLYWGSNGPQGKEKNKDIFIDHDIIHWAHWSHQSVQNKYSKNIAQIGVLLSRTQIFTQLSLLWAAPRMG